MTAGAPPAPDHDRPERPERPEPRRSVVDRAARATGRGLARGTVRGVRAIRSWNASSGARESGLARLVELHALQTAGDAFITVALAGSLFFSVPTHQARPRVALYLLVAMAPFALVAPVLGPLLDRFAHGRRLALAATVLARATLALVIGHALAGSHLSLADTFALYPAALGVLVAQKTYSIVRSAAVPRLLPPALSLVQANSRLTLVGVFAPGVAGGVAVAITKLGGHQWALRVGALVYLVGAVGALRLPRRADGGREVRAAEQRPALGGPFRLGQVDKVVAAVLRPAAALRWFAGFLLLYGAFVVQEHSIAGLPKPVALGALAVGLGVGNVAGTFIGARTGGLRPVRLTVLLLAGTVAVALLTAIDFGVLTAFGVAFVSAAAAAAAKLVLDATIQARTPDDARTSTFGRSETTLQLAWVVGGAVGILLPTRPAVGFGVAAAALAAVVAVAWRDRNRSRGDYSSSSPATARTTSATR